MQLLRQNFDWTTIERVRGRYEVAYYDEYVAAVRWPNGAGPKDCDALIAGRHAYCPRTRWSAIAS